MKTIQRTFLFIFLAAVAAILAADSVLSLIPNSRSNTARGLVSIGRGEVGVRHEMVLVYVQLY